jgi:hypothetical protein
MVKPEGDLQRGSGSNYSRNYPNVLCEAFFWIVFDTEENVDKLPWHGSDMPFSALVSFCIYMSVQLSCNILIY